MHLLSRLRSMANEKGESLRKSCVDIVNKIPLLNPLLIPSQTPKTRWLWYRYFTSWYSIHYPNSFVLYRYFTFLGEANRKANNTIRMARCVGTDRAWKNLWKADVKVSWGIKRKLENSERIKRVRKDHFSQLTSPSNLSVEFNFSD